MKSILTQLTIIVSSICMFSCANDDQTEVNNFKGFYKINSINSSLPIDLNNDGLKTNNYLQEIKSNYISYNGQVIDYNYNNELIHNFAEARPTKFQNNTTQFLDIRFPIQRIDSIYQGNEIYVKMNMEYTKLSTGFIYKLIDDKVEIEDPFNHFESYNINHFEIKRMNKNEFELMFNFKVYDFEENNWVETTLKASYIKVEE